MSVTINPSIIKKQTKDFMKIVALWLGFAILVGFIISLVLATMLKDILMVLSFIKYLFT